MLLADLAGVAVLSDTARSSKAERAERRWPEFFSLSSKPTFEVVDGFLKFGLGICPVDICMSRKILTYLNSASTNHTCRDSFKNWGWAKVLFFLGLRITFPNRMVTELD